MDRESELYTPTYIQEVSIYRTKLTVRFRNGGKRGDAAGEISQRSSSLEQISISLSKLHVDAAINYIYRYNNNRDREFMLVICCV